MAPGTGNDVGTQRAVRSSASHPHRRTLWTKSMQLMSWGRSTGGQLVASSRIPSQALLAAIEADEKEEAAEEGTEQLAAAEGEN